MPVGEDVIEDALRKYPYYVPKEALAPIYTRRQAAEEAARAAGVDPTWGEAARPMVSLPNLPGLAFKSLNYATGLVGKGMRGIYEPEFTLGGRYPGMKPYADKWSDIASQIFMMGLTGPKSLRPEWAGEAWPAATLSEISPAMAERLAGAGRATELSAEQAARMLPESMQRLLGRAGLLGGARALETPAPVTGPVPPAPETGYLPSGPPTKATPELEAQPYRVHGTPDPIMRMVSPDMVSRSGNLVGPGFYSTDSYHVARGYAGGPAGEVYRVYEVEPIKWLDADVEPFPTRVLRRMDRRFPNKPDWEKEFHGVPAKQVMERFSTHLSRDYQDALVEEMKDEGYGGLYHTGGRPTGTASHQVKVYWDPEKQIRIRSLGTAPPPAMGSYP